MTPGFHLKLTILKPWVNQCIFLMEMFVLSYANVLCLYPKLCLQVGSASWPRTYLTNQYVILRYCSPNLCKWNYLYGGLPFFCPSLVAQTVKPLSTMWETWVRSLGREDPLEKEMATHSSILAWKIPWTEEPGRLHSMGSQRVEHNWATSLFLNNTSQFPNPRTIR